MSTPQLDSIEPGILAQYSVATIVVTGKNFSKVCSVLLDGKPLDTTTISETVVYADIDFSNTLLLGERAVQVRNNETGETSQAGTLVIGQPPFDEQKRQKKHNEKATLNDLPPPLKFPNSRPLDSREKGVVVNSLFSAWGALGDAFRPYIVLSALGENINPLSEIGDDAQQALGNPVLYCPFPGSNIGIRFQYLSALVTDPKSTRFFAPDATRAVYTLTESFSVPLTYGSARVLSAAVLAGLITRLVLQDYRDKWAEAGGTPLNLSLGLTDFGLVESIRRASATQTNPGRWHWDDPIWKTWTPKPDQTTTFEKFLSMMMDACSFQGAGFIMGWSAGDSILNITETAKREQCIRAIWRLVGSKFTTLDIGVVVAYTLNYLVGFVSNERTVQIVKGTGSPSETPSLSSSEIILRLENHLSLTDLSSPLAKLSLQLFEMVVDESYAVWAKGLPPKDRDAALEHYRAFINGFQRGCQMAAEAVFVDTLRTGYSIGYSRGFRDGYSQGYAAGYEAGYVKGLADGKKVWSEMTSILHGLSAGSDDLTNFLKNAQTAGTVIVAIAAML